MSICLGIDLGLHLGFSRGDASIGTAGKILEAGTVDLDKKAKQLRCSRETAAYSWMRDYCKEHGVEVYCREDSTKIFRQEVNRRGYVSKRNLGLSLEQHAGYAAALMIVAETRKLKIVPPVDPTTLKKWSTDNGRADKEQMTKAAQLLYGLDAMAPDAADAAHVCAWAMKQVRNEALKFQGVNW